MMRYYCMGHHAPFASSTKAKKNGSVSRRKAIYFVKVWGDGLRGLKLGGVVGKAIGPSIDRF